MVNIFFTDYDPVVAAKDSCDKYVIKIPVEVATMLSAVHWRTGYNGPVCSGMPLKLSKDGTQVMPAGPYRDSRVIKSSSEIYKWLVKSTGNYNYAIEYGLELIAEYKKRYGKLHLSEGALLWLKENIPNIPNVPMTTDVGLAMPEKYKNRENPTLSYKLYLFYEKSEILKWDRGEMPDWYREMIHCSDITRKMSSVLLD